MQGGRGSRHRDQTLDNREWSYEDLLIAAATGALMLASGLATDANAGWFGNTRALGEPELFQPEVSRSPQTYKPRGNRETFTATRAPRAYMIFCLRNPGECKPAKSSDTVAYSPQLVAKLNRVNNEVMYRPSENLLMLQGVR